MPANYVLLQRIELNASASSISFTNIPQSGYTDLKVVVSARNSGSSTPDLWIRMNGLTTGYSGRFLSGNGASAGSGTRSVSAWAIGVVGSSSTTSNTFGNQEIYIPNYLSSTAKSVSSDSVQETNATTAYMYMFANLQSSTAAINSLTFLLEDSTSFVANSTFSLYGLAAVGTTPVIAPKASGGNITSDGTYWYHAFLSSGTFTPLQGLSCDVLTIAGGGGGSAGGGGAGGLVYSASNSVSSTAYTVTVGAGGAGNGSDNNAFQGSNSQFGALTAATGGGYGAGGAVGQVTGGNGGSGGGAGAAQGSTTVTASGGSGSQGSAGGGVSGTSRAGGGGGGYSAAGSAAASGNGVGGTGGNGTNTYSTWASATTTGVSGYYAGGGGGTSTGTTTKAGGAGGGGTGGGDTVEATVGTINTGSGGGGSRTAGAGKAGGSGIVIVRYTVA